MNTNTPEQLSESLLKACKAAGIEKPRYIAQDKNGEIWAFEFKPTISYLWDLWDGNNHETIIDHPPYATDWQDSLLEWVESQETLDDWKDGFSFTEAEKQQIEDYAVAENEPLADVLARHPEHIADTSKMIRMEDALAIAYRAHMTSGNGYWSRADDYRQGWQDSLVWKAMAVKGVSDD